MKKTLRFILKIPLTPFVLVFWAFAILLGYTIIFFEWLYGDEYGLRLSQEIQDDVIKGFKRWFTTI